MSIRKVQLERLILDLAYSLYSTGIRPTDTEFSKEFSAYLSKFPAGEPLPVPLQDVFSGGKSNTNEFNELISRTMQNLDVLYEASLRQMDSVLQLGKAMNEDVSRLKKRRRSLEAEIDNYLLAAENTGDYFYSFGESFSSLDAVDLNMTTAQVNLESGTATIPSIPYASTSIPSGSLSLNSLNVKLNGNATPHEEISSFSNAAESDLDNIYWSFRVASSAPGEVVAEASISLGQSPSTITKVTYDPYGPEEVQAFISTDENGFERILTSSDQMTFVSSPQTIDSMTLTMRKTKHDYTQIVDGKTVYYYLMGAKSIKVSKFVYDTSARIVSSPISLPADAQQDSVIDSVSLVVDQDVPDRTNISYYVGASSGSDSEAFSDVAWKAITPLGVDGLNVISFNGTNKVVDTLRHTPTEGDSQLFQLKSTGPISERNPNPTIIPGVDTYKLAKVNSLAIPDSFRLVEGLNTTKIRSKSIDNTVDFSEVDLTYWATVFNPTLDYARIDGGNDFFYGGDVGAVGKDVYIETFLEADQSYPTFLERFSKIDARSKQWDVKIYLNGRELAYLEQGEDSAQLPWAIREGLNHIVILARIPAGRDSSSFLGSLELMRDSKLYDYGLVRLSEWEYVSPFEMRYNQIGNQVRSFTIIDETIVSRRKPTDNFQVRYTLKTGQSPEFIRLRAELSREGNSPNSTPTVNGYRIRFSYVNEVS